MLLQHQNLGRRFGTSKMCSSPPSVVGCCPFQGGGSVVADALLIVTSIVGFCNCPMFGCALFCVHSSFASWLLCFVCLPGVSCFIMMPRVYLQFVIVVFPDHTHYFELLKILIFKKVCKNYIPSMQRVMGKTFYHFLLPTREKYRNICIKRNFFFL